MRIQQFRKILLSSLTVMATAAVLVFTLKLYFSPEPVASYLGSNITQTFSPLLSPKFDREPYDQDSRVDMEIGKVIQVEKREDRPNIILVLAQGLGYGDLGCYGNPLIPTPNIDRLAHQGSRATSFYAANSSPSPARAALMTGRYAHRTGVSFTLYPGDDPQPMRQVMHNMEKAIARIGAFDHPDDLSILNGLPPSEITLARALKTAGYATALFGKWELGDFTTHPEFHPRAHGFDTFAGFSLTGGDWPIAFWEDRTPVKKDIGSPGEPAMEALMERALAYMDKRNHAEPFFLVFSPTMAGTLSTGESPDPAGNRGRSLRELDQNMGRLMDRLTQLGLDRETLILLTSDTGPVTNGRTMPFQGKSGDGREGGFRIPFLAWWPGHIPPASRMDFPANQLDIFPTLLQLAGLSLPGDRIIDGQSLLPSLTGKAQMSQPRQFFYFHGNQLLGIRNQEMKYIDLPFPALFDLDRDPS
ncbi:MAG: sulfatase-like hydrolase/transferase, partial [Desulfobacterales bacterium]|nr:sulfatase-like hydrolase/transferase [Desulfobacterales bacterium]